MDVRKTLEFSQKKVATLCVHVCVCVSFEPSVLHYNYQAVPLALWLDLSFWLHDL